MLRGLYTAASGMINAQYKQDVTANNIANSDTTGFKQDKVISKTFKEVMLQNKENDIFGIPHAQELGTLAFGVDTEGLYTDFKQGDIKSTGRGLDLAITGLGWFNIDSSDETGKKTMYTRDGSFSVDGSGNIVSSDNGYVLAKDISTNRIGPMQVGNSKVTIDSDGDVFLDSVKKYTLEISQFSDYTQIEKNSKNMYIPKNGVVPDKSNTQNFAISQGSLEASNNDILSEMTNMITNLRSFQANQKVMQSIDETLAKTVNEVGSLK